MTVKTADLYAKDKNLKPEDVRILQEWLKKQPHLPQIEEYQILAFLHSCYYKIEPTKITIDNYFTMRTHHPEIFQTLSEDTVKKVFSYLFVGVLPKRTPEDYCVLLVKIIDGNPDLFNMNNVIGVINMVLTLHMHQYGFETGGVVVFDGKGFSFAHLKTISLTVLKYSLEHVQEGAPVRIKGIHFINVVPALEKFKMLFKPILKSELFNMIQFHNSLNGVHTQIPLDCLPEAYGGKLASTEMLKNNSLQNVLENYDYFHWHESQKVDESKRIGEVKGSVFGVDGTFKKIEID